MPNNSWGSGTRIWGHGGLGRLVLDTPSLGLADRSRDDIHVVKRSAVDLIPSVPGCPVVERLLGAEPLRLDNVNARGFEHGAHHSSPVGAVAVEGLPCPGAGYQHAATTEAEVLPIVGR